MSCKKIIDGERKCLAAFQLMSIFCQCFQLFALAGSVISSAARISALSIVGDLLQKVGVSSLTLY